MNRSTVLSTRSTLRSHNDGPSRGKTVRLMSVPNIAGNVSNSNMSNDSSDKSHKSSIGLSGMPDELLEELDPCLDHLYDPDNMDHLSLDQQLARIEQRDLWGAKFYKLALGVFGQQRTAMEMLGTNRGRKRVIHAQPREFYRGGGGSDIPKEEPYNAPLRPQPPRVKPLSAEALAEIRKNDQVTAYKSWFEERKAFREALDTFGDVAKWLDGKSNKTALERMRYKEICSERRKLEVQEEEQLRYSEEIEEDVHETKDHSRPQVKRPSPLALGIIDAALKKRKMRLVDLFTLVDKDKSWTLSREEFHKAFNAAGIHMPSSLLEDLVITLDRDNNNELDYRELSIGLEQYRIERRQGTDTFSGTTISEAGSDVANAVENTEPPSTLLSSRQTTVLTDHTIRERSSTLRENTDGGPEEGSRRKLDRRTASPASLGAPQLDTREDRYICDNMEMALDLRKRDKTALKHLVKKKRQRSATKTDSDLRRSMVRTGNAAYDNHCIPTTLTGDIAESLDKYRQNRFREYMDLLRLCEGRGIVMSEKLLQRVLLYPGDKPPAQIRRNIRQPGSRCPVSRGQVLFDQREAARGARRAAREAQEAAERRARRRRAVNLSQVGAALPTADELIGEEDEQRVHLSTGWATVKRKVDCWLTFEEYEQLVCNLPLTQHTDIRLPPPNAFWPGAMLDKMRVFLEDNQYGPGSVFRPTVNPVRTGPKRSNWGYDNDLRTTPMRGGFMQGDPGRFYMTSGNIDPQLKAAILRP